MGDSRRQILDFPSAGDSYWRRGRNGLRILFSTKKKCDIQWLNVFFHKAVTSLSWGGIERRAPGSIWTTTLYKLSDHIWITILTILNPSNKLEYRAIVRNNVSRSRVHLTCGFSVILFSTNIYGHTNPNSPDLICFAPEFEKGMWKQWMIYYLLCSSKFKNSENSILLYVFIIEYIYIYYYLVDFYKVLITI